MCPLEVIYMPDEPKSIFETLVPFVQKLVDSYKQTQQTKWDNEWMITAIGDIEMSSSKENVDAYILKQEMPKDFMDVEGATKFATEAMGLLQQKEIATGGLTPEPEAQITPKAGIGAQAIGQITGEQPAGEQTELMPDVKEFNELYKFVSELPTGKVDWTNSLNVFKQRLESGRAMGTAAQQFLTMIMGQMMPTDQRAKFEGDVKLSKEIQETLYPKPASDYERWLQDKESFEEFKAIGKEPTFDFEKFLKENPDWEIKTITSAGNVSIGRRDTTKKWEFDTWEEARNWAKAHPQEGYEWKVETQGEGFNVTAMQKTVTLGAAKLVPTPGLIASYREDFNNPENDPIMIQNDFELKYETKNIKNPPTLEERAKKIYDFSLKGGIESYGLQDEDVVDKEGFVKDLAEYAGLYKEYEQGAREYYDATGKALPKKYLSLEEAGKYTGLTWGKGEKGGYRPVLNTENIPWSWESGSNKTLQFVKEAIANGRTFEDYNPEVLRSMGIDIDEAKRLFNQSQGR